MIAELRPLTPAERSKNASKKLGLWLGFAVVAIFIPILHFILVPTFLLVAIFMAAAEFRKTHFLSNYTVPCDKCQTPAVFSGPIDSYLLRKNCSNCRTQICVDLEAPTPLR